MRVYSRSRVFFRTSRLGEDHGRILRGGPPRTGREAGRAGPACASRNQRRKECVRMGTSLWPLIIFNLLGTILLMWARADSTAVAIFWVVPIASVAQFFAASAATGTRTRFVGLLSAPIFFLLSMGANAGSAIATSGCHVGHGRALRVRGRLILPSVRNREDAAVFESFRTTLPLFMFVAVAAGLQGILQRRAGNTDLNWLAMSCSAGLAALLACVAIDRVHFATATNVFIQQTIAASVLAQLVMGLLTLGRLSGVLSCASAALLAACGFFTLAAMGHGRPLRV